MSPTDREELARWVELQRALSVILTSLHKLTEAQTHTIGATLNYAIGEIDEMKTDYATALSAIKDASALIKAQAIQMQDSAIAAIEDRLRNADDN